jgi:hypothetical protein
MDIQWGTAVEDSKVKCSRRALANTPFHKLWLTLPSEAHTRTARYCRQLARRLRIRYGQLNYVKLFGEID